jgi:hypothetical protein
MGPSKANLAINKKDIHVKNTWGNSCFLLIYTILKHKSNYASKYRYKRRYKDVIAIRSK